MKTIKRKDLAGAKRRGMVTKEEARAVDPGRRHRRYCPMTGDLFLPSGANQRGFFCECAAYAWGELNDNQLRGTAVKRHPEYIPVFNRKIKQGTMVVLYDTGERATVEQFLRAPNPVPKVEGEPWEQFVIVAKVLTDDGEERVVQVKDVERIQSLTVRHFPRCRRTSGTPEPEEDAAAPAGADET